MGNYRTANGTVTGDEIFDICDHAISHLILYYEANFGRRPLYTEIMTAWNSAAEANLKYGAFQSPMEKKQAETQATGKGQ